MALPPKKPATGRAQPGKPAPSARRGAAPAPSSRASAPPPKNNMPMILGIVGGGLAVVIVLAVVLMSGEDPKPEKSAKIKEPKVEAAKKAPPPDVSGLEATGKSKCEEAQRLIQPRLSPDPSSPKDRVFNDLENGLKIMNEGLDAYKKATALAGKKYPIEEYQKLKDRAIKIFCTELEREGQKSCEEGLRIIKSFETQIVDTNKLSDDERSKLYTDLKKGADLIRSGMGLFARSEAVSGHPFDTTPYQEALKVARPKIAELKPN